MLHEESDASVSKDLSFEVFQLQLDHTALLVRARANLLLERIKLFSKICVY